VVDSVAGIAGYKQIDPASEDGRKYCYSLSCCCSVSGVDVVKLKSRLLLLLIGGVRCS
jgi:hypothetical protein